MAVCHGPAYDPVMKATCRSAGHPGFGIAPAAALIAAAFVAFMVIAASAWVAIHQPWLGVSLAVHDGKGLRVAAVSDHGPGADILSSEDIILAIAAPRGAPVQLRAEDIIEDPDTLPTFRARDSFRERQGLIHDILRQPVVVLTLADGRLVRIQPQGERPLSSLPATFWLLFTFAVPPPLIGTIIWAVGRRTAPAACLMLSGFGATCLLASINVIATREIALDETFYPWATFFYHLGSDMFTLGMIGLLWNYPRPLGRFPIVPVVAVFMALFLLNENMTWTELPGNSVLLQVPAYWLLGVMMMVAQWIRSRDRPLDRAVIKALVMLVSILIIALAASYFAPVFGPGTPKTSLTEGLFGLFAFYIILALLVQRYRLFDIDRWWSQVWLWLFAALAVVVFDIILVSATRMVQPQAFGIAVIAVVWLYFPLRQWLWGKWLHHEREELERHVPLLIGHFMRAGHKGDEVGFWEKILEGVFHPLEMAVAQQKVQRAEVVDDGLCLRVPCLAADCCIDLYHADRGTRLFAREDAELAQALRNIARRSMALSRPRVRGMEEERRRIMRDLHDEVGGRLLTLTHTEGRDAPMAAEALRRLREIIYSLDAEQEITLNAAVARW
ncbi:MAG: hypothetical protein Q9M29_05365, partial [Mariprofundaceae bacterium]|nr:hypothetical protein [Mariprofundaceae bacterium]